jgi:hypothetical protein
MKIAVEEGGINNFQMAQPAGPEKFNVNYGSEKFTITSTVQKVDGKLLNEQYPVAENENSVQCRIYELPGTFSIQD